MKRAVKTIGVVVLGGVVAAIVLFGVTGYAPIRSYLGMCQPTVVPGFDPWTGEPHGGIWRCPRFDGSAATTAPGEVPDELIDRPVVPLPVGFALGAFIALVWLRSDLCRRSFPAGRH